MIYKHRAKLYAYQKTEIDQILGRLMKKVETAYEREIDFSNHTLRRTSGRMLWKAKVPLEVIKEILGHQDPVQTIRYLGLNLDDQDEAMSKLAQYQNSLAPEPDELVDRSGFLSAKPVWLDVQNALNRADHLRGKLEK